MTISVVQALLLALVVFFLKSTFTPNLTFYWSKPLITCLFVGLIMGDMQTALSAGIAIQLVYIGIMGIGSVIPADTAVATVIGCSIAICLVDEMGLQEAVSSGLALAVAVGTPATAFTTLVGTIDTAFNERSKAAALKGNVRMQRLWQWVPNQVINFILWVPMIFLVLIAMGNEGFLDTLTSILTPIAAHLKVVSGVLPAVGIALALRTITTGATLPYVILGFAVTVYFNLPIMGTTIIAVCIAVLVAFADIQTRKEKEEAMAEAMDDIEDI